MVKTNYTKESMDSFNEKINAYAQQEFGKPTEEVQTPVAEMAPEPTTTPEPAPIAEATPEPPVQAEAPTPEATATPTEQPNFDAFLDEMSAGTFKSVDEFKAALPKFGEYESLASQKAELEAKLAQDPFANDYVKKFNEFVKSGATADQIKNFQKVNEIGDPNQLSPLEAKITKMVMVDGYNEKIARDIVTQDFPIEDYEEGSQERIILEERLRVSSKGDAQELTKFIADATQIDTSIQQAQEQQRLTELASKAQYQDHIKAVAPQIASQITGLGEIALKDGDDALKLNIEYPSEFKATVEDKIANYFLETGDEVNPETIAEANGYIQATYLAENFPAIAKRIADTVESATWEKAVNKYENRSGLPEGKEPVGVENSQAEYADFLKGVANGGRK